jgi:hypothetical protein
MITTDYCLSALPVTRLDRPRRAKFLTDVGYRGVIHVSILAHHGAQILFTPQMRSETFSVVLGGWANATYSRSVLRVCPSNTFARQVFGNHDRCTYLDTMVKRH